MGFVSNRELFKKGLQQTVAERRKLGQSGQALMEYILVMIVVVAIILGGLYQLSSAFQVWANSYFGEYLSCLLETGELPTLGSSVTTGECAQSFQQFSIANGRPLVNSNNPGGEAQGGGGANSSGDDGQSGRRTTTSSSVESGPGGVASSRRTGRSNRFRAGRSGAEKTGSNINRETRGGGGAAGPIASGGGDGRPKRIALGGSTDRYGRRGKTDKGEDEKRTKTKALEQVANEKVGPKLIPINRKVASNEQAPEVDDFTFGSFLRYLVIAAIIIALLIFFGGQILQVSKSME